MFFLNIFEGLRQVRIQHRELRDSPIEVGLIDLPRTIKPTFSDKVLINSRQQLWAPFKILQFVFEVMKFIENYYKVLIEFHRSSPDVTQNGGAKRKAQPANLHAMKKHSAEFLVRHTK